MSVLWLVLAVFCGLGDAASVRKSSSSYDTIVIGLGAAGTTAATTLAQAGKRVLGLEAQDRIGGRVRTVPCCDGVVELGAEWIHGTVGSPTYKLAQEHNVTILQQSYTEGAALSDGQGVDSAVMGGLVNLLFGSNGQFEEEPQEDNVGSYFTNRINEYITQNHPELVNSTFLRQFLVFADLVTTTYDGSDSWFDVSTRSRYQQLNGSQEMSWHRNGYKTLFDILLKKHNHGAGLPTLTVRLSTEVTQVVWPQDPGAKVLVRTKDGAEYTADNVIVTVSVGVLKERHRTLFSPELPPKKVTAIETISLGVVNKIVLFYQDQWWPENIAFGLIWTEEDLQRVPEEDKWITKVPALNPPLGCKKALTLWTTGETAKHIETLPEDVVREKSSELLRRFLSSQCNVTDAIGVIRTTWYSNPYTRGSYSYDNLLTTQHPTNRADLAEPLTDSSGQPRVLFAGEASHTTAFSTVHGAVLSGTREAERLLGVRV